MNFGRATKVGDFTFSRHMIACTTEKGVSQRKHDVYQTDLVQERAKKSVGHESRDVL
jgi:hypothetical protein